MSGAWVEALREGFRRNARPERAASMQAYMKSAMPFYGVATPEMRRVCRSVFAAHPLASFEAWQHGALGLWRQARLREERYAAIELTGYRFYRAFQTPDAMSMYEEMIVTGAWWDYVDAVAVHRVGPILLKYPEPMKAMMKAWSRSPDLWKRRTSIICQLSFKEKTDLRLLYGCIEPNLGDREFFIRKAIGWALRQVAWTDPKEIVRYVAEHGGELSGLSRREALKNIGSPLAPGSRSARLCLRCDGDRRPLRSLSCPAHGVTGILDLVPGALGWCVDRALRSHLHEDTLLDRPFPSSACALARRVWGRWHG